ncbi:TPA: hypothetical protein ACN37W_004524 [Vibrio parahaemolyticus]
MIKKAVVGVMLIVTLSGCTNILTYINTDNRHHNTGCNAAKNDGDGLNLGNQCKDKIDEQ